MTLPLFFAPARRFTAQDIATLTGARLLDPAHAGIEITGIASAEEGDEGALVFIAGKRHAHLAERVKAAVVLCTQEIAGLIAGRAAVLVTPHPQAAFAQVGRLLYPSAAVPGAMTGETGISPQAHVDPSALLEPGVIVEAGAVVGALVHVGAGTVIAPHAVVGRGCQIGRGGYIGPHATVQYALLGDRVIVHGGAQIGQDGFGFVAGPRGPERIPQIGRVVIQDGVEIGANTTVDRGAMGDTVIGEGTKIDNLVQVAHNVRIGRGCLVAAHCGLSGSVTLEDFVMLGGRVGIADHLTIGRGAQIAAASGLMEDVPAGQRWGGTPAVPVREWMRQVSALRAQSKRRREGSHE